MLPSMRCALTAPFHPYLRRPQLEPGYAGGLLSAALSLGLPPPGVTRHRVSMEPGLSSLLLLRSKGRLSGRLVEQNIRLLIIER